MVIRLKNFEIKVEFWGASTGHPDASYNFTEYVEKQPNITHVDNKFNDTNLQGFILWCFSQQQFPWLVYDEINDFGRAMKEWLNGDHKKCFLDYLSDSKIIMVIDEENK